MSGEKNRAKMYAQSKSIYQQASGLEGVELSEVLTKAFDEIEDDNAREAISFMVWHWFKVGAPDDVMDTVTSDSKGHPKTESNSKMYQPFKRVLGVLAVVTVVVLVLLFYGVIALPTGGHANTDDRLEDIRVGDGRVLIVFVHGFKDDGEETWTNEENGAHWPNLLVGDPLFNTADLRTYHYSSGLFDGNRLSIPHVSDRLAARLDDSLLEKYDSVVFVAHSMGGLVVRNLLLKRPKLAEKVPLVYFLATPTSGSKLADAFSAFGLDRRQLRALKRLDENEFLASEHSAWRSSMQDSGVHSLCAFETRLTNGVIVVSQASAESLCDGRTIPANKDHSGIAKPSSRNSLVYKAFGDRLRSLGVLP